MSDVVFPCTSKHKVSFFSLSLCGPVLFNSSMCIISIPFTTRMSHFRGVETEAGGGACSDR